MERLGHSTNKMTAGSLQPHDNSDARSRSSALDAARERAARNLGCQIDREPEETEIEETMKKPATRYPMRVEAWWAKQGSNL